MPDVAPDKSSWDLVDTVRRLAAPASEQTAWAHETGFPAEEMALELYDEVPGWLPYLRERGYADERDERALLALKRLVEATQVRLFEDGPVVTDAVEWKQVRKSATKALTLLLRPWDEKNTA